MPCWQQKCWNPHHIFIHQQGVNDGDVDKLVCCKICRAPVNDNRAAGTASPCRVTFSGDTWRRLLYNTRACSLFAAQLTLLFFCLFQEDHKMKI